MTVLAYSNGSTESFSRREQELLRLSIPVPGAYCLPHQSPSNSRDDDGYSSNNHHPGYYNRSHQSSYSTIILWVFSGSGGGSKVINGTASNCPFSDCNDLDLQREIVVVVDLISDQPTIDADRKAGLTSLGQKVGNWGIRKSIGKKWQIKKELNKSNSLRLKRMNEAATIQ